MKRVWLWSTPSRRQSFVSTPPFANPLDSPTSSSGLAIPKTPTSSYGYDTAGRLTSANLPGSYPDQTYGFGSTTCGAAAAGNNTNRTTFTEGAQTATYCYDAADKLVSSTAAGTATFAYDERGNTTSMGSQTMTYDGADRHLSTSSQGTVVSYVRDATDRIVSRTETVPEPIAQRAVAVKSAIAVTDSLIIDNPGAVAGDLLIASLSVAGLNTGADVAAPAGWTYVEDQGGPGGIRIKVFRKLAGASEPPSYQFAFRHLNTPTGFGLQPQPLASQGVAGGIAAYGGVDPTAPVQAVAFSSGDATTVPTAPSVTPTLFGTRLVATFAMEGSRVTPAPAGMANAWNVGSLNSAGEQALAGVTSHLSDQSLTWAAPTGARSLPSPESNWASVTVALAPKLKTTTTRYGFTGLGDAPSLTMDASNAITERTIGLAGGVLLTKKGSVDTWHYPNIHGDILATAGTSGARIGDVKLYDPFGRQLSATALPNFGNGWLGQHQKFEERSPGIVPTVEMGARQYVSSLGRFLEVDPVEGGCSNDYVYVHGDPIKENDLDGNGVCNNRVAKTLYTYFGYAGLARAVAGWAGGDRPPKGFAKNAGTSANSTAWGMAAGRAWNQTGKQAFKAVGKALVAASLAGTAVDWYCHELQFDQTGKLRIAPAAGPPESDAV